MAAGGDGYLSVVDLRKPEVCVARSDNFEEELLCMASMKVDPYFLRMMAVSLTRHGVRVSIGWS